MHRIEINDKQQGLSMAWHGLTEIKEDLSLEDNWLAQWDVKPASLDIVPEDATELGHTITSGFSILTATDNPAIQIGVPFNPESYRFVTNREFLDLMQDATEGIEGVKLVSVGSVRNRGRVFASFETMELGTYDAGGRTFNPFLNFGNGHDKSSALWVNTSNNCTVCDNTFEMNLENVGREIVAAQAKVYHRKHLVAKLPELALIVRQAVQAQENFALAFNKMADKKVMETDAEAFFYGFVVNGEDKELSTRASNIVTRLMDLFRTGKGNKGETLADMFSAITDFYTHENAGNGKNPWKQFASSQFGSGQAQKALAFEVLRSNGRTQEVITRGEAILAKQQK